MAREDLHFRLRIPEGLKGQIEKSAAANNRSMTAEMISRLERSFDLDDASKEHEEWLADHEKRIDKLEAQIYDLRSATGLRDYD